MNRRSFLLILGTIVPFLGTACSLYPERHPKKPLCDPGQKDTKEKPCREWAAREYGTCPKCGDVVWCILRGHLEPKGCAG